MRIRVLLLAIAGLALGLCPRAAEPPIFFGTTNYDHFYEVYLNNQVHGQSMLVTSDSVLHAAHVLFDNTLRAAELYRLDAALRAMTGALAEYTLAQAKQEGAYVLHPVPTTVPIGAEQLFRERAHVRVAAYVMVAKKLLEPEAILPDDTLGMMVNREVALILAHEKTAMSPILGVEEDYTQYNPRGHYTRNETFGRYFRAMLWFGRADFRLSGEKRPFVKLTREEIRENALAAILLSRAMQYTYLPENVTGKAANALVLWRRLYQPTAFLVGEADDLIPPEVRALALEMKLDDSAILKNLKPADLNPFIAAAVKLRPPKILGAVQSDMEAEPPVGARLLGQRFVWDSYFFQQLVHPKVPDRDMPTGLDMMAVLGSRPAGAMLRARGEFAKYPTYEKQLTALRAELAKLDGEDWQRTAYLRWLQALRALAADAAATNVTPGKLPAWWTDPAWQAKQLNTALGSWAELRHDTILYTKQSYTPLKAAEPRPAGIYVEPVPQVYLGVKELMAAVRRSLAADGMFPAELAPNYDEFEKLLQTLLIVSYHEVPPAAMDEAIPPPTQEHWEYLRRIGYLLRGIENLPEPLRSELTGPEDAATALIADVHTDLNSGSVLEVGIGRIMTVTVPWRDGDHTVDATGPIFSYYEFTQPMAKRLTDADWQAMLQGNTQSAPLVLGAWLNRIQ